MSSKPPGAPSLLREPKCDPSRRSGRSSPIPKRATSSAAVLYPSLAWVSVVALPFVPDMAFQKLSGVFEARIYPAEFSIPNIQARCKPSNDSQYALAGRIVAGVDLNKLEKTLKEIDYPAIRKRRAVYARLYHEASISHQQGRGISFTDMLFLLAHHKLIVDREALVSVSPPFVLSTLTVSTQTERSCREDGDEQAGDRSRQFGSRALPSQDHLTSSAVPQVQAAATHGARARSVFHSLFSAKLTLDNRYTLHHRRCYACHAS